MGDDITPIRKAKALLEVGGGVDESRATLAIYGDDLDPDVVSILLGCQPSHAHRKGDRKKQNSRPFAAGAWLLTVETKVPHGPEEAVAALLAKFPQEQAFWRPIIDGYRASIRIGIHTAGWNRGFGLSPEILATLARIGLGVDFDLYLYGDETDGGV